MPDVITLGETCAVLEANDIGRMRYAHSFRLRPGGAEGTVAVGVHRLGFSSGWISMLGRDELGEYVLRAMRAEGVDVSRVELVEGMPTGVFFRERLPGPRARHFYYRDGSAFSRLTPEDLDETYISSAKILHVTGITPALSASCREAVFAAIHVAQAKGALVSFDPNMRRNLWSADEARPVMERLLRAADISMPGLDDLQGFLGAGVDQQAAVDWMRSIGCSQGVLKLGADGAAVFDDTGITHVPTDGVDAPVDVAGAGDAFAAGYLVGRLKGWNDDQAAGLGNRVARLAIMLPGNIESMPRWADLEKEMSSNTDIVR